MGDAYFDIPVEITNPFEKKVAEAFQVYDHNNVNMVDAKDIGAILRSLGCVPSEKEIKDVIEITEFPNHPGNIHLSEFLPYLKLLLLQNKMRPSPPEALLGAFKVLDPENKGYIEKEIFLEIIKEIGDRMEEHEINEMMKSAVDPSDNKVHYENYISQLVHEPEESIYKLAADTSFGRGSKAKLAVPRRSKKM